MNTGSASGTGDRVRCDHEFWPLGVTRPQGGSAAYCRRCYVLRWLNAKQWKANEGRRQARYLAAAKRRWCVVDTGPYA